MKILTDVRNELLKRREVKVLVESASNPGLQSSIATISENLKAKEDSIAIKAVKSKFGRNTFLIDAFIYDTVKAKEITEPKKKVKKADAAGGAK